MSDSSSDNGDGLAGLKAILMALQDTEVAPGEPVEILIRVRGKEDRTLKITLDNIEEVRQILKTSMGLD